MVPVLLTLQFKLGGGKGSKDYLEYHNPSFGKAIKENLFRKCPSRLHLILQLMGLLFLFTGGAC